MSAQKSVLRRQVRSCQHARYRVGVSFFHASVKHDVDMLAGTLPFACRPAILPQSAPSDTRYHHGHISLARWHVGSSAGLAMLDYVGASHLKCRAMTACQLLCVSLTMSVQLQNAKVQELDGAKHPGHP